MSQQNYFYEANSPNIIVSSLENIQQNLPTDKAEFVNIASTGQNYNISSNDNKLIIPTIPRTQHYSQGSQLLQNQIIANEFEFLDPASSENVQWQNVVQSQPVAITTAWYNSNPNEQIYPSTAFMQSDNYYALPQYLDPYFLSKKPSLQEKYLKDDANVDKKKVKKRSYDEIVDSFVKSNLESLKKCKNKEKHVNYNKEVNSPKKKIETQQKKNYPKKILTPKKPSPIKEISPKRNVLSDTLISKCKTKTTALTEKQERPTSWASKYLQSISQDQQIINDVKSRKKLLKETKLSKDSKLNEKPAVKTASNTVKYQAYVKDLRKETVKKTLKKIKNDSKKKEKKILEAENKKKIIKSVFPNKHKKTELNSNVDKKPVISISKKKKNCVIAENIKIFQNDNAKENIAKGNNNLLDKRSPNCPTNVSTKISNKIYSTPNCLMRSSIVKVPLDTRYENESKCCKIVEDLRTILDDKKKVLEHCQQIRESHKKTFNLPIKKTKTKIVEPRKPINKIKLIINIVHSDQKELSHSDESSSPNDSHEDLSFLDDLDINVLIDGLNDDHNKQDCKEGKDNTQEVDYFESLEKENRRCFEKDIKLASKKNENCLTECAIEEQLASIFSERSILTNPEPSHKGNGDNFSERSILTNPEPSHKGNGDNDHCNKTKLEGSKKKVDSVNYNNLNCNELSGNFKRALIKNTNTKNIPNSLQNSYKTTLYVESMIAQIHGEEVLIPTSGEPQSHGPPSQFDLLDLTTENESVSENTTKTNDIKFSKDSSHYDKISKKKVVTVIEGIKRENNDETQSHEVVKTEELLDIQECKEEPSVGNDSIRQTKLSFQELKDIIEVFENKLVNISPRTSTINDKTEHKNNRHGLDNLSVDNIRLTKPSFQEFKDQLKVLENKLVNISPRTCTINDKTENKNNRHGQDNLSVDNIRQTKLSFQECKDELEDLENELVNISPRTCTINDKTEHKNNRHGQDDLPVDITRQTKLSFQEFKDKLEDLEKKLVNISPRTCNINDKTEHINNRHGQDDLSVDNIRQTKLSFQELKDKLKVLENELVNISPRTCTINDKTEHKNNRHGQDTLSVDRSTEHLKLNILEPSNTSLNAEVAIKISKVNTKDDVIKKTMHKTTNEPTTSTHKIEPNIVTKDRVLVKELEERMLSYLQEEYKIISMIHEGGFSTVYKCINAARQQFAVKVLKTTKKITNFGFERETMMFEYQKDVPKENLHCVYLVNSFGLLKSRWGFLMEYYPRNVQQYLQDTGSFHIDVIQQLAKQLIGAVNMLRHYNIVHSDIRPNHILINDEGNQIKLCGFDRSYYTQPAAVLPNIGTINYRAPEIILGFSASFSVDVWSIAVVLYEMATASKLFPGHYNNDILYKQMCLCGNMPIHMILHGRYAKVHFKNSIFMRQVGARGETRVPVRHFKNDEKLGLLLYNAYVRDWFNTRYDSQINKDSAKLQVLQRLIEKMLRLNPTQRQGIEFVFSNPFIYQS